ncbi:hypothetical protein D3C78_1859020 [compost metagenome]
MTRHRHQFGQPGIKRIDHEKPGHEGCPNHHRAEPPTFAEKALDRAVECGLGFGWIARKYHVIVQLKIGADSLNDGA